MWVRWEFDFNSFYSCALVDRDGLASQPWVVQIITAAVSCSKSVLTMTCWLARAWIWKSRRIFAHFFSSIVSGVPLLLVRVQYVTLCFPLPACRILLLCPELSDRHLHCSTDPTVDPVFPSVVVFVELLLFTCLTFWILNSTWRLSWCQQLLRLLAA